MANVDSYTTGLISDKAVVERRIQVLDAPLYPSNNKSYAVTFVLATWSRQTPEDWKLIALGLEGERVWRDEKGNPQRRPEEKVTERFARVNWAPVWVQAAAKSHKPAKSEAPKRP
jgi:hypothetical protein